MKSQLELEAGYSIPTGAYVLRLPFSKARFDQDRSMNRKKLMFFV
jgi:hypothetical protein